MFGGNIRIFKFRGVDVNLDFSVIIMMLLFFLPEASRLPRIFPSWSGFEVGYTVTIIAVLFVVSILIHEMSHAIVGMRLGATVIRISLYIFGGATEFSRMPATHWRNFWVSMSGPISNLLLWGLFTVGLEISPNASPIWLICFYLSTANFLLGVFNLLPGYPLDGGQALRSFLSATTKNERLASRIVLFVGMGIGGLLAAWAVVGLLQGDFISVLFRGFVAYMIINGSQAQWREFAGTNPNPNARPTTNGYVPQPVEPAKATGITFGQVMARPAMAFAPTVSVAEFLSQAAMIQVNGNNWLPVLKEGFLMGLVTPNMGQAIKQPDQLATPLEQVMTPRMKLQAVNINDDIARAREIFKLFSQQPIAVLGDGGYFAGVVTPENLRGY